MLGGGHSNVTVLVRDAAGKRVVLRRPPLGAQPRGAHDVLREARVMTAAGSQGIPVAEVLATCADTRVLGAPFAVTAFIDGAVVDNPPAVEQHLPLVATRVRVADELVDTLAALHAVEPTAAGLGDLVRTETFLERQLRRYAALWADDRTRELPLVDELHRRLVAARPAERYRGLVHADFRLGNCLVGPDGRLRAVLDWELAAVGDVLADLAIFLNNWAAPGTDAARVWMEIPPTCAGGFPTADQLLERYVAAPSAGSTTSSTTGPSPGGAWRSSPRASGDATRAARWRRRWTWTTSTRAWSGLPSSPTPTCGHTVPEGTRPTVPWSRPGAEGEWRCPTGC